MSRKLSVTLSEDDLRPLIFQDRATGESPVVSLTNNKMVPENVNFTYSGQKKSNSDRKVHKDTNSDKFADEGCGRNLPIEHRESRQYRRYSDKQYFQWGLGDKVMDSKGRRVLDGRDKSFDNGFVVTEVDGCELCSLANKSFEEKAMQRTRKRSTISKYCIELREFEVEQNDRYDPLL